MTFFQTAPVLSNLYQQDFALQAELKRRLKEKSKHICIQLEQMGHAAAQILPAWLREAEQNPPRHIPYDAWGNRIDQIVTSAAWEKYRVFSAESGVVSIAYDKNLEANNRVAQTALLYLFSASSATYSCPLAMTDAAARVLLDLASPALLDRLVPRLLSQDPQTFITSGQWMTERIGGSDVSHSETIARLHSRTDQEEYYTLHGVKWFTSATTSEMALTLARIEGEAGLTLFCVELNRQAGQGIAGIRINRLKDKLGTKALPTAELTLDGVVATQIGPINRGVASIANMLNVTRYYNAVASASSMALSTLLVQEYAKIRQAFGKAIGEHVLFQNTLAVLQGTSAAAMSLCFEVADLLGKVENKIANDNEAARLRVLLPIAKLLLAKQAVAHASETLECFGGAGYVEDTGLPRLLRDAQVLPIWEGTTNVLALDVLRAEKKQNAFTILLADMSERLGCMNNVDKDAAEVVHETAQLLQTKLKSLQTKSANDVEGFARRMSITAGLLLQAVLLAEAVPYAVSGDNFAQRRFTAFVEHRLCGPLGF